MFDLPRRASTCCRELRRQHHNFSLSAQAEDREYPGRLCIASSGICDAVQIALSWQGWEGRVRAYRTAVSSLHAGKEPAGPNVTYSPGQAAASRTHPGLENCSQVSRYQSWACRIPKLFWFSYFLTCNDSSSFTSSFGGNKSLAWIYSKLGGPSSPCIANKTHIETGPNQQVLRKPKIEAAGCSWHPNTLGILWTCAWKHLFCLQTILSALQDPSWVQDQELAVAEYPQHSERLEAGLWVPSLPTMWYLESQADTPRLRTGSWTDVTVICHVKCYPITFTVAPQQKHHNTEFPSTVQLWPTLPPLMFIRIAFFGEFSFSLLAQRNLGRAWCSLRRICKCET